MFWEQTVEYATLSDIGFRRQNNQDCCVVLMASTRERWQERGHVFVVADGMGGHAVGELASKIAIDTVPHTFHKLRNLPVSDALRKSIEEANTAIHNRGQQNRDFHNMGTTCTSLVLCPAGAIVGHIGDSRLYRIRDQRIDQLTFDHSLQWELLKQGRMRPEEVLLREPRNVITRCLGPQSVANVDLEGPLPVLPGDTYLLCSDGLTGLLSDEEIGIVAQQLPPADACRLLVNLANLRGGTDNITVVIARVGPVPEGAQATPLFDPAASTLYDWLWVAAFAVLALLIVAAVCLMLFSLPVESVLTTGVAIATAGGMVLVWLRQAPARALRERARSVLSKPHRSAPIRFDPKFMGQLAALEHALQQTAAEEGWTIDWPTHQTAYSEAKQAVAARDDPAALRSFARAIQVLMLGIQYQRRRMDHLSKWGSTGDPAGAMRPPPSF